MNRRNLISAAGYGVITSIFGHTSSDAQSPFKSVADYVNNNSTASITRIYQATNPTVPHVWSHTLVAFENEAQASAAFVQIDGLLDRVPSDRSSMEDFIASEHIESTAAYLGIVPIPFTYGRISCLTGHRGKLLFCASCTWFIDPWELPHDAFYIIMARILEKTKDSRDRYTAHQLMKHMPTERDLPDSLTIVSEFDIIREHFD